MITLQKHDKPFIMLLFMLYLEWLSYGQFEYVAYDRFGNQTMVTKSST